MRWRSFISAFILLALLSCGPRKNSGSVVPGPEILENLAGNYTMKMTVDNEVRYSTAVVKESVGGQFQIARITVYGPMLYSFTLSDGAVVHSDELGDGTVRYQSAIQKLTIRFEKGKSVCELTR